MGVIRHVTSGTGTANDFRAITLLNPHRAIRARESVDIQLLHEGVRVKFFNIKYAGFFH